MTDLNLKSLLFKTYAFIQDCNRFHAGEVLPALRSKGKNKLFDEKGVFGRVCRHDFPKSLLSIKHGQRKTGKYVYCVYQHMCYGVMMHTGI